jgi:hypothetical protein
MNNPQNEDYDDHYNDGFLGGLIATLVVTVKRGDVVDVVIVVIFGVVSTFLVSRLCRRIERWFRK